MILQLVPVAIQLQLTELRAMMAMPVPRQMLVKQEIVSAATQLLAQPLASAM